MFIYLNRDVNLIYRTIHTWKNEGVKTLSEVKVLKGKKGDIEACKEWKNVQKAIPHAKSRIENSSLFSEELNTPKKKMPSFKSLNDRAIEGHEY